MKLRTLLVGLLGIVIVAGVVFWALLGNVDRFRPKIQAELQSKLNRPVTIGKLGLKLLPLEIKVDGLTIGESPAFPSGRPFATASTVFVSASLLSIMRGNPEVNNLILDKPQIELIKNPQGVWNFSSLGSDGSAKTDTPFSLGLLKINDGQAGYTDQMAKQPREVYDHIDLALSDFAPNKEFGISIGLHFGGDGGQLLAFKGKAGPLSGGPDALLPPVNGHLTVSQVPLADIDHVAPGALPANLEAILSGESDIQTSAAALSGKGTLKLEKITLNGAKMEYPITTTYDFTGDTRRRNFQIKSGVVQLGPTTFIVSGTVDGAPKPSLLDVHLKTDNSSITELAKLTGALGFGFSPAYRIAGKLSADVTAKGPSTSPQLNGTITAKGLEASGGEIKQPVSIPEIDLKLSPSTVMSNTFTAKSGATALAIAFTLAQYATKNPNIDATVKTDRANIAELLNIAKAYGVAAGGAKGEGTMSLDVHVKGPTSNASALAYSGSATIANAKFETPQLTKPLAIASANAKFSQNSVALDGVAASVGATNLRGSLSARNFSAPQVAFNLSADKIDTDEMERLIAPAPPALAKSGKKTGAPQPSMLQLMTGSGTLAVGELKASDFVLKNVNGKCQIDRGVVELAPFSTDVFGGKAAGSLTADMRPATPQIAEKIKFSKVDANSLLSAVSSMKNSLTGSLSADTNLRFSLLAGNDLARTLNGIISFDLTDGVIKNVNIINEVEKVAKFLKSAGTESASGGGTAVKKFSGTMNIANGVATTNNLTGVLNAASMASTGTLDLASQTVNMHVTAVLGNSMSESVGGSKVGGFLSTALANNKGELVVPVLVTGNMSHPIVTPDAAAIAKMKLANLLPSSGNPAQAITGILGQVGKGGGLGGVLGGILGGKQQQQQQQPGDDAKQKQQQQNENPFGGLLDQFRKKKPAEPPKQ